MSYDKPNRIKYSPGHHDFGAAGEVWAFTGPKGKKGRIYDYGVEGVTEAFTADTTAALVSVGSVADADLYGDEISMLTTAVDTGTRSLRTLFTAAEIATGIKDNVAGRLLEDQIAADAIFALHVVAPTGGTPAGMGIPFVIVDWDD